MSQQQSCDLYVETVVSQEDARQGCEKQVSYRMGDSLKRLMVKISLGAGDGIRIRLSGIGLQRSVSDICISRSGSRVDKRQD